MVDGCLMQAWSVTRRDLAQQKREGRPILTMAGPWLLGVKQMAQRQPCWPPAYFWPP